MSRDLSCLSSNIFHVSERIKTLALQKKDSPIQISEEREKKEQLTKAIEERTERLSSIGPRQRHVLDAVSEYFNVTLDVMLEGMADSEVHIDLLNDFFENDGILALMFFYYEMEPPGIESGRYNPLQNLLTNPAFFTRIERAIVTDGTTEPLSRRCVVSYRKQNAKQIELRSLADDVCITVLDLEEGENPISAIKLLLNLVTLNALECNSDYGLCHENEKDKFLRGMEGFIKFLNSTDLDIKHIVSFTIDQAFFEESLLTPQLIKKTSSDKEKVFQVEHTFMEWLKTIQNVLIEGIRIRRDPPDVGPLHELQYWCSMYAKYTSIIEFVTSEHFNNYLMCLRYSRSKLIKKWIYMDKEVTEAITLARDNVRYMQSLERFWEPLYNCYPPEISYHLPSLMQTIRLIYSTSLFFNTSEIITGFMSKITNQIIIACQNYLTDRRTKSIWEQDNMDIIKKIDTCKKLEIDYKNIYYKTVNDIKENPNEKEWECSYIFIFGKIEAFDDRLNRLKTILETSCLYSVLDVIYIEGMDVYSTKVKNACNKIESKTYDPLEYRKKDFDVDYEKYTEEIEIAEYGMRKFVKDMLLPIPTTASRLIVLRRFERLYLDCLCLDHRYLDVAILLEKEIEDIKDIYNSDRGDPPIPFCVPPVIGRIQWVRSIFRKMDDPMSILRTKSCVIEHKKAQLSVKYYNYLSSVMLHYEMIHHKGWYDFAGQVRKSLEVPILKKNSATNRLEINLKLQVSQVVKETESMWKLGLVVPHVVQMLTYCKNKVIDTHNTMDSLIKKNNSIRLKIPVMFLPLMRPQLLKVEQIFDPGLSIITWTSDSIDKYFDKIENCLNEVDNFLQDVRDIHYARVLEVLTQIAKISLVCLPVGPENPEDFFLKNDDFRIIQGEILEIKSLAAENAAVEIINKFVSKYDVIDSAKRRFQMPLEEQSYLTMKREMLLPIDKYDWIAFEKIYKPTTFPNEDIHRILCFKDYNNLKYDVTTLHNDCNELFSFYNSEAIRALVLCTKSSLHQLRNRASVSNYKITQTTIEQLFSTKLYLQIPVCVMIPTLEEIQKYYAAVIKNVVDINNYLTTWGKQAKTEERNLREPTFAESMHETTWFKIISEHKDIVRIVSSFDGGFLLLEPDISYFSKQIYDKHKYLWADDREEQILEFVTSNPLTADIREMFMLYENIADKIKNMTPFKQIGPINIDLSEVIESILVEAKAWKIIMGRELIKDYKARLSKIVDFISAQQKILARTMKDLDDVRLAMACLQAIRENFLSIDMDLLLMEETYAMFAYFEIDIPPEDIERVEGLRYNFTDMLNNAKHVSEAILLLEEPLKNQLSEGVATFQQEILDFDYDFEIKGPMMEGLSAKDASDRVLLFQARFDELWRKYEMYSSGEKLFGLYVNEYPSLHYYKKTFALLNKLYSLYLLVMRSIDGYLEIPWVDVDIESINSEILDFQKRCRVLPQDLKDWPAYIELKQKIDDFNDICPLLEFMSNNAMKDRHWQKLESLLNHKFEIESPDFTLGDILAAPLLEFKDDVEDTCIGAIKERDIESKLKQVQLDWAIIDLTFANFKARGELLVKPTDTYDIISLLEDSLMIMNSLSSNRYNVPFKKDIMLWLSKLANTSEILEKWLIVQNLWIYLEAVFVGGDISKQLPAEAKRFSNIDKTWVRLMFKARQNPNVIECCTGDETMIYTLPLLLEQLEACQKSLTGYLEAKRLIFPRFFFISDPVLLEILGQSSDPTSIQPHLLSVFDAVALVEFDAAAPDNIISFFSANGEQVLLDKEVKCTGGVEFWIGKLLDTMQSSIRGILSNIAHSIAEPDFDFIQGFQSYCGQAGLLGVQLLWTKEAEYALKKSRTQKTIMKTTNDYFLNLLNSLIELTVKDLTKLERIRFETMVTIHVHQRDIFDDLYRLKIKSILDFEWQKQARFYYIEELDDVIVKITDVDFIYQNEYLGVIERLAITPLTDRCYITLAQAIGMSMGGAPAGPAGTGKTETTKDMGRALGKLVVVFNCSDQMDFRGLGRIYKGLAQSGSWGCFDEFNRIDLPVLSVAAQQIYIVLTARKEKKTSFLFSDGDIVSLNLEFGLFITMNPGYAGRQELPENLKIQFRSVAMMVPDRQIIIRVKLASCGFKDNVVLSRKFFTLYKLCEEQLSKQVHYDFGLRNILSVLRTLGSQKRANPTDSEETIVMRVLRDMNVSKLVDEDEPLFISLIEDLFPGIKLSFSSYKDLQKAITVSTDAMNLINHPEWNLKIVQLYETSLVRHGLMTMGPTGAGKTKCINTLLRSFSDMGNPHREMRMNPKAITAPQMFGRLDVATNDWTDGIFSTLWRRSLKIKKTDFVWIVLDGPVDAVWIENLNSVLDDNKTLTLANGDRIVMAPNCKLVFEPDNVDNASPATVSRVGMVFMSASALKWRPILYGWLKSRPPEEAEAIKVFFNKIYDDLHIFVQTKLISKMKILEALYIRQCIDVLQGLLLLESGGSSSNLYLERLFLFSLMWSLGAVLELEEREKLEDFVIKHPSKMKWPKPQTGETIFEYVVDSEGNWQHWNNRVEEYMYPSDSIPEYASILIPNVDNVRTAFLIDLIAKQIKAVLLIGEQGTAKTVMIKSYLNLYDPEFHMSKSLNFSSATTPNMYQRTVESYVEKRVGLSYGPPQQRKMTVFIDDINMPIINEWGDQVTNEIVRQMMETVGFFSLDKPGDFIKILDIQIMAAMIHPGGGRNDIPPRLKRQFNIFNCTIPSNTSMDKIFGLIGVGYFCIERFSEQVVEIIPKLVPLTRILWQFIKIKMLPTPAKFHYVFNLRDLSRIWQGMLTIQGEQCETYDTCVKLWRHECTRVIADRFTNYPDRNWFYDKMRSVVYTYLEDYSSFYPEEEIYFVDFLREAPELPPDAVDDVVEAAPKVYEEISSFENTRTRALSFLTLFNENVRGAAMDLVFFKDALVHLIIISRVIRTPRGNALLVGVGGSGKQSLTKLASFIANYKFYQITLTRTYNVTNLMDDLKYLYRTAGLQLQGISFIFTDNDIKDEAFLEYINNVLSSGEVANLFPKDELDEVINELIPVMKRVSPKRIPTIDNLYDFFISSARNNLHVVLCFSPVGEKFRSRSLKFPGLISGCTMDWFQRWPEDALIAVSDHFILNFPIVCVPDVKNGAIELMAFVHNNVAELCLEYFDRFRRQVHVTPKSYLSFLEGYKTIYKDKHDNIDTLASRMQTGLVKLVEASVSVDILKKELEIKNVDIIEASAIAEGVLSIVQVSANAAEIVKAEVMVVKTRAEELVAQISSDTEVAEKKLEAARPALEAAEAALKTIKAADIATVRKLGKPPYLIALIMDAVLILFKRKVESTKIDPDKQFIVASWGESLKVMSDTRFLGKIVEYQTDLINSEMIDLLTPYFEYSLYTFESAKIACGNVAGLLSWTIAMAKFYEVNKDVLPLKANLARQQVKLNSAITELNEAETILAEKEGELAIEQAKFNEAMFKKQLVLDDAKTCQDKMDAASALIDGLAEEKIRWTEQSALFKSETERLVGDVIILTGFLSYTGPFNQEFRSNLQKMWLMELNERKIPASLNINIIENLSDGATIGEWNMEGLPTDELSVQNGIIVTKASRYPLLIDPQSQGKSWIKNKEEEFGLIVSSLNHKYFRTHLEDAISQGRPMLIEDVAEDLDPILDNILDKNFIKFGSTYKVKIGDKEVDVHKAFRLYITTKFPNPSYTPEVSARTSIIDFTVTIKGLEDQLLGRVILTEKKELESERTALIADVTANKRKKQELEANLLHKLATVEGSLVDDVSVITVLNISKATSIEVKEKLEIAKETELKINTAREEFRPVATRGSVLYFLICSMTMVNRMYQTSLVQFLERFDISMARSDKSPITYRRMNFIIEYLTYDIYKYKSRGLYEIHKYLFLLMMTLKIDLQRMTITMDDFNNLIKGGGALDIRSCAPKPFKWMTDMTWLNLVQLSSLRAFQNILTQVSSNEKQWKLWFDKEAPEDEIIPDGYSTLDSFRKLLIIRAWCPDRTLSQSRKYVISSMGQRYGDPVVLNYDSLLEESRPLSPLVCFLSMGSDPTPSIESLAKKNGIICKAISMGQGQEVHARKLISESVELGSWVLLQNCHLGLTYMTELMILILELEKCISTIHEAFRIWITTEVHPQFSITLLQQSIKFTNEPPAGIKAGLKRTYGAMGLELLEYSDSPFYLPLIFGVSFLHTVVQERRKFGPLGWNIPYEFNSADWLASCYFMQNHLDDLDPKRGISWSTVRYMLGEVQYGGRVTDDYDKRLLNTFSKVWFSEKMFTDEFEFFKGYKIMKFKTLDEYSDEISNMSSIDPPQVYGLHRNADITYQSNTTAKILDTILSIQPKEASGSSGETRESIVARQAIDMLAKVPPSYDPYEVLERLTMMGLLKPMNIFLRQEIDRMQKVILLVRATLKDLLLAIEGTIIMNEQLRDALDNIYDAKVPDVWNRDSWSSSTLGFWFTELLERNLQFSNWCHKSRPLMFWMTGFFNPQGFLTAMRQEVTRAHKGWALDMVTLHNDVTKILSEECKTSPAEGVFVYGLFLDGAGWDRRNNRLTEALNKVLYTLMPIIHIYAINSSAPKDTALYECPVYKKPNRTGLHYITPLWIISNRPTEHWILRGVALLCDIK